MQKTINKGFNLLILFCAFFVQISCANSDNNKTEVTMANNKTTQELIQLSQDILTAAMQEKNTDSFVKEYANLNLNNLEKSLSNDTEKLAFWINTYNAYILVLLQDNPDLYIERSQFFSKPKMNVAGIEMSFDDFEHGIIRRSKNKLSGGYLGKLFPPKWEKKLRTDEVDYRIHFALNCGAKSCPPVKVFSATNLDAELDESSKNYLEDTVIYNEAQGEVEVPALLSWFRADFGSKSDQVKILQKYGVVPEGKSPSINFLDYDWTLDLTNFVK